MKRQLPDIAFDLATILGLAFGLVVLVLWLA